MATIHESDYRHMQVQDCARYFERLGPETVSPNRSAVHLCEVEATRREHTGEVLDATLMALRVMKTKKRLGEDESR